MLRMSCCCPTEAPVAPGGSLTEGVRQSCDKISAPSIPSQNAEPVLPIVSAPILVAVLGPSTSARSVVAETRQVSRLDPRPGPSPVLANYALLI
jgi:hypothetical protein